MSHPSPDDEREWLELSTGVQPVTTPRAPSGGPPAAPVPHLTNGVPIPDRPPLRSGDHATIAAELIAHELEGCVVDEEKIWRYQVPAWTELHDREAAKVVMAYSGRPYLSGKGVKELVIDRGDVTGSLACAKDLLAFPGFFDGVAAGVGFRNGFLAIVGGKATLLEPDSKHRVRAAHDFDFDPRAPHAELDGFLETILGDDSEEERCAKAALLQEFFGAALFGLGPSFQKCLLFFGKAGNGKSEVLEVLRSIFPDQGVVSSLPPHMWGEQFSIEQICGKLVNIVDEIPPKDIVSGSVFKAIITGNPVAAERKYQPKFTFRPRAAHVFSANELPATADLSDAFFDRFMILHLRRRIRGTALAVKDAGRHVVESCRPGIVAWAVDGARRLLEQGHYTLPASSADLIATWRRDCDNVAIFFHECTVSADNRAPIGLGNGTKATRVYDEYRQWCSDNGFRSGSSVTFGKRAEAVDYGSVRVNGIHFYPVNLLVKD